MNELKKLYDLYKIATEAADIADEAWAADAENEELEAAFDEAYNMQYEAMEALIDGIVSFSAGQIDKKTARLMITKKGNKLADLMARVA